ncbi:hypothetical protein [Tenacibaculum sp. C7A-26P2]|uniref:hypothetical protein n=1 Tax=Tenacibaculum sp. C7A-26P2 TaxID=3447504 RepID=UPI003F85DDF8
MNIKAIYKVIITRRMIFDSSKNIFKKKSKTLLSNIKILLKKHYDEIKMVSKSNGKNLNPTVYKPFIYKINTLKVPVLNKPSFKQHSGLPPLN